MFKKTIGVVAGAVGCVLAIGMAPAAASADEPANPVTTAEGQFLSGSVVGLDLDGLAALAPASARNDGTVGTVQEHNPLDLTVIGAITLDPGPVALTDAPGVDAGVIGQHAVARDDGYAFASSGLLGANGAVSVSPGPGASVTIDLAKLLGDRLTSALAGLRLQAQGIAAQASAQLGGYQGAYTLADAKLDLVVPAIAQTPDAAGTALAPVQAAIASLTGSDGAIAKALSGVLSGLDPSLSLLGGAATVDVRIDAALQPVLDAIRSTVLSDDALSVNLGTGEVTADLARLSSGPSLNALAPGQEILSSTVVGSITSGVERLLGDYLDGLADTIRAVLDAAQLHVAAHIGIGQQVQTGTKTVTIPHTVTQLVDSVTGALLGTVDGLTGVVTSLVPGLTGSQLTQQLGSIIDPILGDVTGGGGLGGVVGGVVGGVTGGSGSGGGGLGGLLGGLLGGSKAPAAQAPSILTGDVVTRVVTTLEQVVQPVFATLDTAADVTIDGSLADVQNGGVHAAATVTVLGVPVSVNLDLLLAPVVNAVTDQLLGSGGAIAKAIDGLDTAVLTPATQALTGDGGAGSVLTDLVSVRGNVQEKSAGTGFRETALRVSLLDGSLATVDLASAAVSSATGGGTTPGGPGSDDPGTNPVPAGPSSLATTGVEPLLYALLAAALLGLGAVLRRRLRAA